MRIPAFRRPSAYRANKYKFVHACRRFGGTWLDISIDCWGAALPSGGVLWESNVLWQARRVRSQQLPQRTERTRTPVSPPPPVWCLRFIFCRTSTFFRSPMCFLPLLTWVGCLRCTCNFCQVYFYFRKCARYLEHVVGGSEDDPAKNLLWRMIRQH